MTKEQIKEFVESHFHIEDEEKIKAQKDLIAHCEEEKNYSHIVNTP